MDAMAKLLEWIAATPGASVLFDKERDACGVVRVRLIVEKESRGREPKKLASVDSLYSIVEIRSGRAGVTDTLPVEAAIHKINQAIKGW